jgi:hypothetical protein
MPFLVQTMAWSGEHRAFVFEEFIQNGGSPIMTQNSQQTNKTSPTATPQPQGYCVLCNF